MNFRENYSGLSDEEPLTVAASRADLVHEAVLAMDCEMARRGLTYQEVHAKMRAVARLEYREARKHRRPRKANKYFVASMNVCMLLLVILGVLLLVIFLTAYHLVPDGWEYPILDACGGSGMAVLAVQPWLRRTIRFWISLVVSFVLQLLVGYWINVHEAPHSRNGLKGAAFLAILAGYAVGAILFLLMQQLGHQSLHSQECPLTRCRNRDSVQATADQPAQNAPCVRSKISKLTP